MAQRKPPLSILNYVEYLKQVYSNLKKAYIFGSFAKGNASKDSDIDVAMVFDSVEDIFDLQVQLMKIRRQYDSRIEPHVFKLADFSKSHPLAQEIINSGIEISEFRKSS